MEIRIGLAMSDDTPFDFFYLRHVTYSCCSIKGLQLREQKTHGWGLGA